MQKQVVQRQCVSEKPPGGEASPPKLPGRSDWWHSSFQGLITDGYRCNEYNSGGKSKTSEAQVNEPNARIISRILFLKVEYWGRSA